MAVASYHLLQPPGALDPMNVGGTSVMSNIRGTASGLAGSVGSGISSAARNLAGSLEGKKK